MLAIKSSGILWGSRDMSVAINGLSGSIYTVRMAKATKAGKFPNYKSNIKEKAIEIKDNAVEKYYEINTEENRQEVKEKYEEIKEYVTPYIEQIKESLKEEASDAKEDYKSIYDSFKEWLNKETTE